MPKSAPTAPAARVFAPLAAPPTVAGPSVAGVEPPSWWAPPRCDSGGPAGGTSLRLLLRGEHLRAVRRVDVVGEGVTVGGFRESARGTYLFVDVTIAPDAAPGRRLLRITTASGAVADAPFTVTAPLPRAGRFQGFSPDDVLYLILPDRFDDGDAASNDPPGARSMCDPTHPRMYHGGDFAGIRRRLPYLKDLGVTALWLTPIHANASAPDPARIYDGAPAIDYHGYGAVDLYAVEQHFGSLQELRALVDDAHALGIKVIQDQVANHVGPAHPWVLDPPTPTWFNGTLERHALCTWDAWAVASPHGTAATQHSALSGWFADILPDLNQDDLEVARYLTQNALWWVGMTGFDGVRQDTLCYVPRRFWQGWTAALKAEFPDLTILGEVRDDSPATVAFFQGGITRADGIDTGVDTLFDYGLHPILMRVFAQGESIRALPMALASDWIYPRADLLVTFLDLHDVPRFRSVQPDACAQRLMLAQTFLLTARGIPLLYFGDEIGMTGGDDPENRRHFPGGFPNDHRDAFTEAGRTPEEQRIFDHVRRLLRLRAELPALRQGTMLDLLVTEQQYAYARQPSCGAPAAVVVLNNANRPARIAVPVRSLGWHDGACVRDRLSGVLERRPVRVHGGVVRVTLPPLGVAVLCPVDAPAVRRRVGRILPVPPTV
jgi:glycosidase